MQNHGVFGIWIDGEYGPVNPLKYFGWATRDWERKYFLIVEEGELTI